VESVWFHSGGPVTLPKLYKGTDRLSSCRTSRIPERRLSRTLYSVPSMKYARGDFSEILFIDEYKDLRPCHNASGSE